MDILSLTSIQPVSVETLGRPVVSTTSGVDPTDKAPPGSITTGAASQKEAPRTGQKAPENLLDLLKGLTVGSSDGVVALSLGDAKAVASLKQVTLPPRAEDLVKALAAMGIQLPPALVAQTTQGTPDTWIKAVQQAPNLPQAVKDVLAVLLQQSMNHPLPASTLIDLGRPLHRFLYLQEKSCRAVEPPAQMFSSDLVQNTGSGQAFDAAVVEALNLTGITGSATTERSVDLTADQGKPVPVIGSTIDKSHGGPVPGEHIRPSPTIFGLGRPGPATAPPATDNLGRPVTSTDQFVNGFEGTASTSGSVPPATVPPIPSPTIFGDRGLTVPPPVDGSGTVKGGPFDIHKIPAPTIFGDRGLTVPPPVDGGGTVHGGPSDIHKIPTPTIFGDRGVTVPPPVDGNGTVHGGPSDIHKIPTPTILGNQGKPAPAGNPAATIVPDPKLEWPVEAPPPTAIGGKFTDIEPKPVAIDDTDDGKTSIDTKGSTITLGRPDHVAAGKPVDAPTPLPAQTVKSIGDQIADRIETMVLGKKSGSVTVRLNPMDLGTITLTVKSFGTKVDTSIQATHDEVRAALHSHRQDLVQNVESRGLSLNSFHIGQDSSGSNRHQSHQALQTEADRNANIRQAVGQSSNASTSQPLPSTSTSTGVDFLI